MEATAVYKDAVVQLVHAPSYFTGLMITACHRTLCQGLWWVFQVARLTTTAIAI